MPTNRTPISHPRRGRLNHEQDMVLQYGADDPWADAFRDEDEHRDAWIAIATAFSPGTGTGIGRRRGGSSRPAISGIRATYPRAIDALSGRDRRRGGGSRTHERVASGI